MASKAVVDAVEARIGATWNGIPVIDANTTDEAPVDGSRYILLQFPVSQTSRVPINDRYYREEGGFRIVLHVSRGEGVSDLLDLADDLATLFRDVSFGGVTTQTPSSPFIDDDNENGNYFIAAVAVPYTYGFEG